MGTSAYVIFSNGVARSKRLGTTVGDILSALKFGFFGVRWPGYHFRSFLAF